MLSLITATLPCASKLLVQIITTSLPAMANHKSGALFLLLLLHHSLISALADRSPREYTNEFAVHLKECSDSQAQDLAHRYGFVNNGKIGNLDCHYLFTHNHVHKRSSDYSHKHHRLLAQDDMVHWVEQQKILTRKKRDNNKTRYRYRKSMPDPIYKDMWYLHKGAQGGFDMNVENAWRLGYTGKGVVVTILDDGIQPNHPELVRNYDARASFDINDNDPDPTPQDNGDNKHGTRCAGEVAAEAYNEYCGVGIAFNASIGGVRMLDGIVTDQVEARAIGLNPNYIDIYSASWGPEDDGKTVDGPGKLAKRAFIDGIKKGRRGKGSIYVWASGNGGRRLDNCNCDGYTNSIYTLSISSATQNGNKPWYLEECSSTLSTTYSSGTPGRDGNILTCDQDTSYFKALKKGQVPQKESLCTRSHTGTSASAPIAAAIFALALEANPGLTWRDVQHLVVLSSRYEPLRHEKGWTTNGVGRKVNHKFGYGLLDAERIVRFAEKWTTAPPPRICEVSSQNKEREVPAKLRRQLEVSLLTNGCRGLANEIRYLEHVQAKITLKYQPRGNLKISLISPSGTISHLLFPRPRDVEENSFSSWPFLSVHFWGERPAGTWRLVIQNDGSKPAILPGRLFSWSLIFYGTYEKPPSFFYNESLRYFPRSTSPATISLNECASNGTLKQFGSPGCVSKCLFTQWANFDINECQPCSNACQACFGPSADNCLTCDKGYFYEYQCLDTCPDSYYASEIKECLPCLQNCLTCSESEYKCTQCREGMVLNDKKQCIPNPDRSSDPQFTSCDEKCELCSKSNSSHCLQCQDGFNLINGSCIDTPCPDGYFKWNDKLKECTPCHESCETCSGPSHKNCINCPLQSYLQDGMCVNCLEGHFRNRDTGKCEACHSSCSECSGPLASDCSACKSGLHLNNYHCVSCCEDANSNNEFTECCQCVSSSGPCASIDKPRSIESISDRHMQPARSMGLFFYRAFTNILTYVFIGAIIIVIAIFALKNQIQLHRRRTHFDYQKLNIHYSQNRRDNSRLLEEQDSGDEEEFTQFEKS